MKPLDKFGKFVIKNLRDQAILHHLKLEAGEWRAPDLQKLQKDLGALPDETKVIIQRCIFEAIDSATHGLLFALQECHDLDKGISVIVDGANVAEISDGLQGEAYGDNGWIAKYSKYKSAP